MAHIDVTTEAFNTKQVCEITETTQRKVRYWDTEGMVKPSIHPATGRGSRRLYSYMDLLAIKTVQALRDQGASLQKVQKCVAYLRKNLPDISRPLNFCTLLTDGETVYYLAKNEKTLIDTAKRQGQQVFFWVPVAAHDRQLRHRVIELSTKRIKEVTVGDYTYQVEVEPDEEDGGYVATVAGLSGCITDGDTLEETLEMTQDAIRCWLEAHEDMERRRIDVPMSKPKRKRARA